jgi:hypothetical protein
MFVTQKDSIGKLALFALHDLRDDVWLSPNSTDEYQQLGKKTFSAGILEQFKEAGNRVGIRLSYRPATGYKGWRNRFLCSKKIYKYSLRLPWLPESIQWNRFLGYLKFENTASVLYVHILPFLLNFKKCIREFDADFESVEK